MTVDGVVLPESATTRLDNGLHVTAVRRDRYPVSLLHLAIPVWHSDLAAGMVASATLFDERAFDRTGFSLYGSCGSDAMTIHGMGLPEDFHAGAAAACDALADPGCAESDVQRARVELSHQLELRSVLPGRVAWRELLTQMYGDHPLAVLAPEADAVRNVSGEESTRFRNEHVLAHGAVLVVSSQLPLDEMLESVDDTFSRLPKAPVRPPGEARGGGRGTTRTVHCTGTDQAALIVGFPSVSRGDPTFPVAALANLIIGGYFSSRLTQRLRQQRGYAYWVRSNLTADPIGPALAIATNVRCSVADAAIEAISEDLADLADAGPTREELDHAKRHLLGAMRLEMAGQASSTSLIFELARNGLSPEWPQRHFTDVAGVTAADVREFVGEFLRPETATTVLVGDERELAA